MKPNLERWHRDLAKVVGKISLRIAKGKGLTVTELNSWQSSIEAVTEEMSKACRRVQS